MPNIPKGWGASAIHPKIMKAIKKQVSSFNYERLQKTNQTEVINILLAEKLNIKIK